ncbi:hypothetical protein Tco_0371690 [Tanacetum coccineum]
MEVFAWTESESTTVPWFVMEHQLKTYPLAELVVHKRRPVTPEGRLALKERVFHWLGVGLIRKVRHPEWITNAIPIKLANGTWKVQMDYSSLNKACSKDMYPFPEEGEELTFLMGIAPVAIIDRQLPFEYTIASRSTNVMVNAVYDAHNEDACLTLRSMTPELLRQFENSSPYEMLQELKSIFEKQAGVERFDLIQTFHACKQEEGKPVGPYVIKMKNYVDQLERLSYVLPQDLSVGLFLNGLTSDFTGDYLLRYRRPRISYYAAPRLGVVLQFAFHRAIGHREHQGMVSNIGNAKKFLMYPRFLQTILGIETSITRQYHVFKLSSKLFANMKLNFVGPSMPLLDAMLSQAQDGEGAGEDVQAVPPPIPETIPETRHESDHSQDHLSTPPRQQATPSVAPVFEHGQRTDSNIASSSRVHETEDDSLGGSFHETPPRFTQASPTGHTSGGAEDHITLSALSSVVSTLVQKVSYLETELKAHKKLFKDVVAKLVKKVKALEVKLKTKKRKVVLTMTVDSTKSPAGASSNPTACSYDPNIDVPTTAVPTDVPSGVDPTGPSTVSPGSTTVPTSSSIPATKPIPARSGTTTTTPSLPVRDARKGKGVAVEEPTPTQDKTFKQLEEERLGWEAAQRLQAQELAYLEMQRAKSLMKDANLARQMA